MAVLEKFKNVSDRYPIEDTVSFRVRPFVEPAFEVADGLRHLPGQARLIVSFPPGHYPRNLEHAAVLGAQAYAGTADELPYLLHRVPDFTPGALAVVTNRLEAVRLPKREFLPDYKKIDTSRPVGLVDSSNPDHLVIGAIDPQAGEIISFQFPRPVLDLNAA